MATLDFLKAMQDLENQALQSLQKRAEMSEKTTQAFTDKVAELMERFNVDPYPGQTERKEPAPVNGESLQGGAGNPPAEP